MEVRDTMSILHRRAYIKKGSLRASSRACFIIAHVHICDSYVQVHPNGMVMDCLGSRLTRNPGQPLLFIGRRLENANAHFVPSRIAKDKETVNPSAHCHNANYVQNSPVRVSTGL